MDQPGDGALSYTGIPADDLGRVMGFYRDVFGWEMHASPGSGYAFFDSGRGGAGGGFVERGEGRPAHPINYVMCDDLDSTLERIVTHGGAVVSPKSAFDELGWLAHVTDTEGNLFGVWQANLASNG